MNKYVYELMVKNNPQEAIKNLILKDKEKEELKEKINIKLSQNSRLLKTANMTNDIFNAIRLQAICNTYIQILEMMRNSTNE